jgi:hypothetical protein
LGGLRHPHLPFKCDPTVTVVAGTLQKAGLITYHHGHLTIVDRKKLESTSCECYRTATAC